jgi:hypothetical protein
MARSQRDLAARAGGRPAELALTAVIGDGDTTLNASGVTLGDVVVGVVEFFSPDENTNTAIAAIHTATVVGNGTISVGSAIAPDHSALVIYFDFTP